MPFRQRPALTFECNQRLLSSPFPNDIQTVRILLSAAFINTVSLDIQLLFLGSSAVAEFISPRLEVIMETKIDRSFPCLVFLPERISEQSYDVRKRLDPTMCSLVRAQVSNTMHNIHQRETRRSSLAHFPREEPIFLSLSAGCFQKPAR